jgi:hypothetical protein
MSRVKKVRETVEKAQELQDQITGVYRRWQDDLQSEIAKIKMNYEYTSKGKEKLIDSLKSRKTIEFLKGARQQQTEFRKYLSDAKKEAEAIVYANTPAVDSEKMNRFTNRFKEVKTEILLATSARRGKEILQDFLVSVDEQGLAAVVKEDFGEIIQPILANAGADAQKFRHDLSKSFEDLKMRSLDPEAIEAMNLAEYAEAQINSKFYSPMVEQNVQQNLGQVAYAYMYNPDEYFEKFPEADKPISHLRTVKEVLEAEEAKKGGNE